MRKRRSVQLGAIIFPSFRSGGTVLSGLFSARLATPTLPIATVARLNYYIIMKWPLTRPAAHKASGSRQLTWVLGASNGLFNWILIWWWAPRARARPARAEIRPLGKTNTRAARLYAHRIPKSIGTDGAFGWRHHHHHCYVAALSAATSFSWCDLLPRRRPVASRKVCGEAIRRRATSSGNTL